MDKILVVDDDDEQRELIEWKAKKAGRQVLTAKSGTDAILRIKESEFDLVLTDLVMESRRAGLEVLTTAKDRNPDTQVILCTGRGTTNVISDAIRLGAFDCLDTAGQNADFFWTVLLPARVELALQFARLCKQSVSFGNNKNIFIVHGHDEKSKWELKEFLTGLGLDPIVLHLQDDLGKTIIGKFEHFASKSAFACILMTPDDEAKVLSPSSDEHKWRARQNVIMELGWFMAKLGRDRVVILHKGDLEIPSDILGVIHAGFKESVLETTEQIRKRLKGRGLIE